MLYICMEGGESSEAAVEEQDRFRLRSVSLRRQVKVEGEVRELRSQIYSISFRRILLRERFYFVNNFPVS